MLADIDELKKMLWLDERTRAMFVHFSVYNANFNTTASRRIRNGYDYLQTICGAFQPVIVHRRGVDIPQADALSRNAPMIRSSNEQIKDYLNGDIDEQIKFALASNISNHERATRMFEEAPMNFPTNYKDDLVRSTPNLRFKMLCSTKQKSKALIKFTE